MELPKPNIEGLTPMIVENGKNGGDIAFKNHVDKIIDRQDHGENKILGLGNNTEEAIRGRAHDWNNVNNKPSDTADMYNKEDINMMHRRVVDEYPEYGKDGSFKRAIEDPL